MANTIGNPQNVQPQIEQLPAPPMSMDDLSGWIDCYLKLAQRVQASTKDSTPPAGVTGLTTEKTTFGILLTWNAATKADGYQVFRNSTGNLTTALLIAIRPGNGNISYLDSADQLNTEQTRYYWIRAYNNLNNYGPFTALTASTNYASAENSLAIGVDATVSGSNSTAVGQDANITGVDNTAVGQDCDISGDGNVGVGQNVTITHDNCVVVGNDAQSTDDNQVIIGSANAPVSQVYMGRGVTHTGAAQDMEIHPSDGSGTDVAGDALLIYGGRGTNAGDGGPVAIYTAPAGAAATPNGITFSPDTSGTLTTSLSAFWKLEEASSTRYDCFNANNFTPGNTPGNAVGKIGNGVDLERGSSQILSVTGTAALQLGDVDFFGACWVSLESKPAGGVMVLARGYTAATEWLVAWRDSSDRFIFQVTDGGGTDEVVANNFGAPSLATFYCIYFWRDSAGTINISVNNGTADSLSSSNFVATGAITLEMGGNGANFFDGIVDEFGFWKKVLSTQEKADYYNAGSGNTTAYTYSTSLNTAYKRFDVTSDGTMTLYQGTTPTRYAFFDPTTKRLTVTGDGNNHTSLTGAGVNIHDSASVFTILTLTNGTTADGSSIAFSVKHNVSANIVAGQHGSGSFLPLTFVVNNAVRSELSTAGAWRWHNYGAGTLTTDASGNITAVSDERLKTRIADLPYGLKEVLLLSPVMHGWKPESGMDAGDYPGFIAQEVGRAMPLCEYVKDTGGREVDPDQVLDPHSYSLVGIVGALVNAVKDLETRLAALEAKVNAR
jgi:hypothetical protein